MSVNSCTSCSHINNCYQQKCEGPKCISEANHAATSRMIQKALIILIAPFPIDFVQASQGVQMPWNVWEPEGSKYKNAYISK